MPTHAQLYTDFIYGKTSEVVQFQVASVGIGVPSPSVKLDVGGDVRANAFFYSSDARLKTNVHRIENAYDKLVRLNGVSYNRIDTGRREYGLIAQEVEDVLPEVVLTDHNGYKSVDYSKIVPLLIEALKEQQQKIERLEACNG